MGHRRTPSRDVANGHSRRCSPHFTITTIGGQPEATARIPTAHSPRLSARQAKMGVNRAVRRPILSADEKMAARGRPAREAAKAVLHAILAEQAVCVGAAPMPKVGN